MKGGSTGHRERAEAVLAAPLQARAAEIMLVVSAAVRAHLLAFRLPTHPGQEGMRLRLGETIKVAHRGRQSLLLKPEIRRHSVTTVCIDSG